MKQLAVLGLVTATALAILPGCRRGSATTETAKVIGTLTYKGKPLDGVSVGFVPQGGGGRPASGTTDAAGRFTLSTFKAGDGAIPGIHKVVIAEPSDTDKPPPMPGMPGYEESQRKPRFPAKYSSDHTSPLTVTVERGKVNDLTLELKD